MKKVSRSGLERAPYHWPRLRIKPPQTKRLCRCCSSLSSPSPEQWRGISHMNQKPTRALLACLFLPFDSDYSIVSVQLEPDNKDTSLAPRYVCTIHRYQKLHISFITTGLFKLLYTFPFFVVVVCFCVCLLLCFFFLGGDIGITVSVTLSMCTIFSGRYLLNRRTIFNQLSLMVYYYKAECHA